MEPLIALWCASIAPLVCAWRPQALGLNASLLSNTGQAFVCEQGEVLKGEKKKNASRPADNPRQLTAVGGWTRWW